MKEPIRKIHLKGGRVRYRLVIDIGLDEDGRRLQVTRTFDRLKDARNELSRIRHESEAGSYVQPSERTVNEYLDEYLKGATRGRRESTRVSYRDSFRCPRERFGERPFQSITKGASRGSSTTCSPAVVNAAASRAPDSGRAAYG